MCSYNVPSSGGDRLKPPPIKAERKIISLKSSTSSGSKSGVDHLKINTVPTNSSKESTIKSIPCSTSADATNSKGENSGENSKSLTKVIQTSPEVNVKRKIIRLNRTSLGLESKEEDSVSPDPDKNGSQPQTFPVKETEDLPDGTKKVSTSDPTVMSAIILQHIHFFDRNFTNYCPLPNKDIDPPQNQDFLEFHLWA